MFIKERKRKENKRRKKRKKEKKKEERKNQSKWRRARGNGKEKQVLWNKQCLNHVQSCGKE